MGLTRLHNEDWGFEPNCFVCEAKNARGLQVPFSVDDERGVVVAEVNLPNDFSGAPTVVHGGVTLAVLDEAQAWACIALAGKWAVTVETTTRFHEAARATFAVLGAAQAQRVIGRAASDDHRSYLRES